MAFTEPAVWTGEGAQWDQRALTSVELTGTLGPSDLCVTLRWSISESSLRLWLEYPIYFASFDKMIIRWLWKQDRAVWFSGRVFYWGICNSSWFRGSHSQRGKVVISFYLFIFNGWYSERHLELMVPTGWFLWHISVLFHNFLVILCGPLQKPTIAMLGEVGQTRQQKTRVLLDRGWYGQICIWVGDSGMIIEHGF